VLPLLDSALTCVDPEQVAAPRIEEAIWAEWNGGGQVSSIAAASHHVVSRVANAQGPSGEGPSARGIRESEALACKTAQLDGGQSSL
jgi:hypothetical protein